MRDQLDDTCFVYFTSYVLNMFRTLICPSSGACDCVVELQHRLFVLSSLCVGDLVRPILVGVRFQGFSLQNEHHLKPAHQISNTQRTQKKATDVVIHQHSRKLLMMDILMSETC